MQMNVANDAINSAKGCLYTATENTETIHSNPFAYPLSPLSPLPSPLSLSLSLALALPFLPPPSSLPFIEMEKASSVFNWPFNIVSIQVGRRFQQQRTGRAQSQSPIRRLLSS